jgi:hypothetical protein
MTGTRIRMSALAFALEQGIWQYMLRNGFRNLYKEYFLLSKKSGCALRGLVLSGFSFSNTNYDNWNSNTNVSSHLCKFLAAQALPTWQKINKKKWRW